MQVRSPGVPDEPSGDNHPDQSAGHGHGHGDLAHGFEFDDATVPRQPDGSILFTVPTRIVVAKFAAAVVVALVALLASNRPAMVIGLIAAGGLTIYALRDVLARERLRADAEGLVTVRGFAGRHRLAWADVERVRVNAHGRMGTRTQLLEVDAGDHIYLYSRFDLGVDPDEGANALESVRPS